MAEDGGNIDIDATLASKTIAELKKDLKKRKLKTTGVKNELVLRLMAALQLEREHGEPQNHDDIEDEEEGNHKDASGKESSDNSDSGEDLNNEKSVPRSERKKANDHRWRQHSHTLSFRDIEGSLEPFSGDDKTNVERWIDDFEEMAELCDWSDVQKVAYAKRLLRGCAKLFVGYEKCTKTWRKLRNALREEFAEMVDSHAIHQELSQSKKKINESPQKYIYRMLEIGAQAKVDTQSVIQYIIEGVQDDAVNKTILYGAKTIRDLKDKFMQYETMKKDGKSKSKPTKTEDKKKTQHEDRGSTDTKRCFNCGSKDHLGKTCPTKSQGAKCFKCNQFGHIAKSCKELTGNSKETACINSSSSQQKQLKCVKIASQQFIAVVDTGSDLSLINRDSYNRIGCPELSNKIQFDGVGASNNNTCGSFKTNVIIDGETYVITFHVLENQIMKHEILIGADFLNLIDLHSVKGEVTIRKIPEKSVITDNMNLPEVLKIDTVENIDSFNFFSISDENARKQVKMIAKNYESKKTREVNVKMTIILTDDIPVYQRPRRLCHSEEKEVDTQINKWLANGIIRPSNSDYASPIVLVKKRNGETRICVDFRKLNKKIIKDRFPLPLIKDQLNCLQNAKIFSTLNLQNGFFHVKVTESSWKYTSFIVPNG